MSGLNKDDRNRIILIAVCIGATAVVYLTFRYILPLVAPFLIALLFLMAVRKPVEWLKKRLRLPRRLGVILILLMFFVLLGLGIYYVGCRFLGELKLFMAGFENLAAQLAGSCNSLCKSVEETLGLDEGCIYDIFMENIDEISITMRSKSLHTIISSSTEIIIGAGFAIGIFAITITAIIFLSNSVEGIKNWCKFGYFSNWIRIAFGRLVEFGATYLRTQFIIMTITAIICTIALLITKSAYPIMIGVLIGIMDALPLIGTGLVLIPWTILCIISGNFVKAAVLFTAYLICYISREILEPKLMGGRMGMPAIIMVISMYIGVLLFGISGFILGPAAYIIVSDICIHTARSL